MVYQIRFGIRIKAITILNSVVELANNLIESSDSLEVLLNILYTMSGALEVSVTKCLGTIQISAICCDIYHVLSISRGRIFHGVGVKIIFKRFK